MLGLGWARKVGGRIVPVRAFTIRGTELGAEDGVPEDREGIALITQRVADNVRILSDFLPFRLVDLGTG